MKAIVTGLLISAAITAHAGFISGNKLLNQIESNDHLDRALALGYIAGVHDAGDGTKFCTPANVTVGQVRDMVLDMLRKVPSERHQAADVYVEATLAMQWPCEKKGQSL